jgi:glycosyltransferase XagB
MALNFYFPNLARTKKQPRFFNAYSASLKNFFKEPVVTILNKQGRQGKGLAVGNKKFFNHTDLPAAETALFNFSANQRMFFAILGIALVLAFIVDWHLTLVILLALFMLVYFLDALFNVYLVYRSFVRQPEINIGAEETQLVPGAVWPEYTIFCPLYKEGEVVPQFVAAMKKLDYPPARLQILLLLEEDDLQTIRELQKMSLPSNFFAVVVPHSMPKTKPKALNYGLKYARGEYAVIYDAEDIPDALQLKKAVLAFAKAPAGTVCMQAKLNFYNPTQNLLTKVFTSEYSLWFDLVLPGLQSLDAPIPLGGTSNHFRTKDLIKLQGWDAFNVTEDCDLGIRLAKKGFKTAIFNSTTWEEANSQYKNWYRQRSRWIKGYMQTFLVHMRQWRIFFKNRKVGDLLYFQLTVGGKVVSLFLNPLMWGLTVVYFAFRPAFGHTIESFFPSPVLYMGVFSFVFGNFFYLYRCMIGSAKRNFDGLIKYTFLVPFYWLGMSLAAWKAVFEMAFKPHYWAKTAHGFHLKKQLDKFLPPVVPAPKKTFSEVAE